MNLKAKIEHLRNQPEHVRLRVATSLTAISGVALVVLWLVVLLPLQLKFSNPSRKTQPQQQSEQASTEQNVIALPASPLPEQGAVSGAQSWQDDYTAASLPDNSVVSPSVSATPIVTPSPEASINPTPALEDTGSPIPLPSPEASSVPVQITR